MLKPITRISHWDKTLNWVKTKEWSTVMVESYCLGAIQVIRCLSINLSYLGQVIDECEKLLVDFGSRNVTLKFVYTIC